jgi:predicted HicB family RNase H-like nuclease
MAIMKPMTYKGYAAQIEYSDEDACFVGHISGIADVIGFHADNVQDLRDAFGGGAVDEYLALTHSNNFNHKIPSKSLFKTF